VFGCRLTTFQETFTQNDVGFRRSTDIMVLVEQLLAKSNPKNTTLPVDYPGMKCGDSAARSHCWNGRRKTSLKDIRGMFEHVLQLPDKQRSEVSAGGLAAKILNSPFEVERTCFPHFGPPRRNHRRSLRKRQYVFFCMMRRGNASAALTGTSGWPLYSDFRPWSERVAWASLFAAATRPGAPAMSQ